jgi:hypothetical protein
VNGTSTVETWTGTLYPDSTTDYQFTNSFIAPVSSFVLCAYTDATNESYRDNDTTCSTITMTPAPNDAGVTSFVFPSMDTVYQNQGFTVTVDIKNYGSNTLTSIPVEFQIGNNASITDTWTGSLVSDATTQFTFTNTFTPPLGSFNACARTRLTNDGDSTNDETCKQLIGLMGIEDLMQNGFELGQNIPNPTAGTTQINYQTPVNGELLFQVFNSQGQLVYLEKLKKPAGSHALTIDCTNLSAGVYYYSMEMNSYRKLKKMVVR